MFSRAACAAILHTVICLFKSVFEKHYLDMDRAFDFIDHQICFAVKSNSNIAVLNVLAKLGAGFDIVSGGELARVLSRWRCF